MDSGFSWPEWGLPGKNGEWKQHSLINSILAACDGGTRRLEDWVGNSSDKIDRGRRPSAAGFAGGASKPRCMPDHRKWQRKAPFWRRNP